MSEPLRTSLPADMLGYYEHGTEQARLARDAGPLEFARALELLARHLPPAPAVVIDVGGGPGAYACELARRGYAVHLIDPVPLHVAQARSAASRQPAAPLASAEIGEARMLTHPDGSADAVLLFGPLYHLPERAERVSAWREAARVLRPGGVVVASCISRATPLLDGLKRGRLGDPAYLAWAGSDLATGQHHNPQGDPEGFTRAYLHATGEPAAEAREAGLTALPPVGVEGPGWLVPGFAAVWAGPAGRAALLAAARAAEADPGLAGLSAHFLTVARKG